MINRILSSPIHCVFVLVVAVSPPLISHGQTAVTGPIYADPAANSATASEVAAPALTPAKHTTSYTAVKGDSLTSIARKFNTTRKNLRALNSLTASAITVKPGDVLLVPASAPKTASAKAKGHHNYLAAQPVQDFDVPASTFASCPVPLPTPGDDPDAAASASSSETATDAEVKPAPIAKLVSPAEMAAEPAPEVEIITPATPAPAAETAPIPQVARAEAVPTVSTPRTSSKYSFKTATDAPTTDVRPAPQPFNPPTPRLTSRSLSPRPSTSLNSNANAMQTASADDWGGRFFQQARALGNEGIEYDEDWRPPGESRSWAMDCSNTSRYLYKVTTGIELPRTASDQYYYLHLQGKAWDVPLNASGLVDTDFLRRKLKPGDLLFWENTYRPERQPPITHVMVYLGTNEKGQWVMAGSQSSRGGEHNRRNGGPDIYVFRPSQPCGGYTTWMGLVRHKGRFCAFGRPLEADPTKLSVAADN